jgi:hypothetical protein
MPFHGGQSAGGGSPLVSLLVGSPKSLFGGVPGAYRSRPLALRGPPASAVNRETSVGRPARRFLSDSARSDGPILGRPRLCANWPLLRRCPRRFMRPRTVELCTGARTEASRGASAVRTASFRASKRWRCIRRTGTSSTWGPREIRLSRWIRSASSGARMRERPGNGPEATNSSTCRFMRLPLTPSSPRSFMPARTTSRGPVPAPSVSSLVAAILGVGLLLLRRCRDGRSRVVQGETARTA